VLRQDGAISLAEFLFYLEQISALKMIDRHMCHGELPLVTHLRASTLWPKSLPDAESHYEVSEFVLFRRRKQEVIAESTLTESIFVFHEPGLLASLLDLKGAHTFERLVGTLKFLPEPLAASILKDLIHGSMLVSRELADPQLQYWEFHDLYFHVRSRKGRHNNRYGGTYPWLGWKSSPAVKGESRTGERIPLTPYDPGQVSLEQISFRETLDRRRSHREFGSKPITAEQLGHFLYLTSRVKEIVPGDDPLTSRPYPSAGARYPLEVYVVATECTGISAGVYHYDPFDHVLELLGLNNQAVTSLLHEYGVFCGRTTAWRSQVVFVITARFARSSWKYESVSYANILKEVGCLCQTMYLVAAAMGLGGCMIGGGNSDLFAEISGTNYYAESSVGEFILGSLDCH
jgi:SagB-type dehydrogenase family enzyme